MKPYALTLLLITALNSLASSNFIIEAPGVTGPSPKWSTERVARGNEGVHGGDIYAVEFVSFGFDIAKKLAEPQYEKLIKKTGLNLDSFTDAVSNTVVNSDEGEYLTIAGQEVDAINYQDLASKKHHVVINRTRWRMASVEGKLKLVLHEYFGRIALERDIYTVSVNFKGALFALSREVLAKPDSTIQYYGYSVGSPALYSNGGTCNNRIPSVGAAISTSRDIAKERCESERERECDVFLTSVKVIRSAEYVGFEYCEILSVAK